MSEMPWFTPLLCLGIVFAWMLLVWCIVTLFGAVDVDEPRPGRGDEIDWMAQARYEPNVCRCLDCGDVIATYADASWRGRGDAPVRCSACCVGKPEARWVL